MSKKKLNKRGQNAKNKVQNSKNVAPRINPSKTIYDVDAEVQAFSADECAEEADVALGVVTDGTEVVNPVTEEVVDVVGESDVLDVEPVSAEEDEEEEEYETDDGEDDNENLDDDEVCDNEDDEYDEEDSSVSDSIPSHAIPKSRRQNKNAFAKLYDAATIIDVANKNPGIVDTTNYDTNIITAIHKAKEIVDSRDKALADRMRSPSMNVFGKIDKVTFRTEFVNWDDTGYTNASVVMDVLANQYDEFVRNRARVLNNVNVDNIYYCGDTRLITSGVLMHTGIGMLPVSGRVANISITMPRSMLDEFIENYTTRVCLCTTSEPVPAHILALAAKGMAPVDGIHAYYVINMPKFLSLFNHERGHNTTLYQAGGYTVMISNYDRVIPRDVKLAAHTVKTSTSIGLMKAAFY